MSEENIFYTYIYLDPRKPGSFDYGEFHFDFEPFYVGKGKGVQWLLHLGVDPNKTYKSYRLNKIRKIQSLGLEPKIIKYKENLTEQEAFDLEKKLIKVIGRLDLGLGPLTNLTDGGEGASGLIHSKESIQKQAEKMTGRTKENDPGKARAAEKMIGDNNPSKRSEVRQKIVDKKKGRLRGTKEDTPWIARMAEKKKGCIPWTSGRTKENDLRVARMAEKLRRRGK